MTPDPIAIVKAFVTGAALAESDVLFAFYVASARAALTELEGVVTSLRHAVVQLEGELAKRARGKRAQLPPGSP